MKLDSSNPLPNPPLNLNGKEKKIDPERVLKVEIPHEIRGFQAALVAARKKNYTSEDVIIIRVLISILVVYYLAIHPRQNNSGN